MSKVINIKISLYYAIFVIISLMIITPLTMNFLSFMLAFNVFLAFIPIFIMWYIVKFQKDINYSHIKKTSIALFLAYVLFYPNTFYIITDFIHLDSADFYQVTISSSYGFFQSKEYLKDIIPYIVMFHITLAMLLGLYAAVYSLFKFEELMISHTIKRNIREIILISILFLSSIGIYIGRFLRFFSWEILKPFKLLSALYEDFSLFTIYFVLVFTFLEIIIYYSYRNIIKNII